MDVTPTPANPSALNTQKDYISYSFASRTSYQSKKRTNMLSNTGFIASFTTAPITAESCQITQICRLSPQPPPERLPHQSSTRVDPFALSLSTPLAKQPKMTSMNCYSLMGSHPCLPEPSPTLWPTTTPSMPKCYEPSHKGSSRRSANVRPRALRNGTNMWDESINSRTNSMSGLRKYMTTTQHQKNSKKMMITKPQYPESRTAKATTSSQSGSASWMMDGLQHTRLAPQRTLFPMLSIYMPSPIWMTRPHSIPCRTGTVPSSTPMKLDSKSCTAKPPRKGIVAISPNSSATATRPELFETSRHASLIWRLTSKELFKPANYPNSACKPPGRTSWSNTRRDSLVKDSASLPATETLCVFSVTARTKSVAKVG